MTTGDKRQRQKEARRSRLEAAREAEARAQRRRRVVTLGIVVVFVAAVIAAAVALRGDDGDGEATPTTPTSDPATSTTERTAAALPDPPEGRTLDGPTPCPAEDGSEERVAQFAEPPPMCIEPGDALEAVVETSAGGSFTIALDTEAAPETANNFVVLARYRYFDGLPFHRLMPDFVLQGGSSGLGDDGSTNWGNGGPGYDLPDRELPDGPYAAGDVAMAKGGAISGSQFFVVVTEDGAAALDPAYPRFGRVTEGLELAQFLAATGIQAENGAPTSIITIESVTIRPAA